MASAIPSGRSQAADIPPPTDVSVVVATRNRHERLRKLITALEAQTYPLDRFEVIVVDDASAASTLEVLERARSDGRLRLTALRQDIRKGPAAARQLGWRAAASELIAFTDDDCAPLPEWLEEGVAAAAANPGTIVQGSIAPDPAELGSMGPFSRTIEVNAPDLGFQCANVFYPRQLLERVGGFDTKTFDRWGGEDADLAWRVLETGAGATFVPEARVRHAVNQLGAVGKLRHAARWHTAMAAYARHDGLRRAQFTHWLFWKPTHYWFARAVLAVALPGRWNPIRTWLLYPYLRSLYARGKLGGSIWLAPYFLVDDLVEVCAVLRGGARFRKLML